MFFFSSEHSELFFFLDTETRVTLHTQKGNEQY